MMESPGVKYQVEWNCNIYRIDFWNQLNYSRVRRELSYGSFGEYTKMNPYVKYKDEKMI
ncbi:MAG: hypothetical protein ACLU4J_11710 [Butyricimonas paravirosa]